MDRQRQMPEQHRQLNKACLNCPRCNSTNTKFCYYNNYSLSQPRHFCKACKRYWTRGGTLRNVPVGGGSRKNNNKQRVNKRPTSSSSSSPNNPQPSSANQASQIVTGPNNNNCTLLAPLFYGLAGHVNSSGYEQGLIQQKQSSYDSDVNSTKEMILTDPFLSDYYSNNNINPISLFLPPPSSFLVQDKDKQGAGDAVVQGTSNQQGHQLIQGLIPFQQQQQQKQEDHPQEQRWDSKQISSDLLGHSSSSVYWTGERNVVSSWPPI